MNRDIIMCFSLGWIVQMLATLLVVVGLVTIIALMIRLLQLSPFAGSNTSAVVMAGLSMIVVIVCAIFLIDLIDCTMGVF